MFIMCNAAFTHVEIPRPRDAIELNNDGMIKLGNVYYQTGSLFYCFRRRFTVINDNSSFYTVSKKTVPTYFLLLVCQL